MWFPKFDSYLMAALILSANKNKAVALTGIGISGLLHPFVALISAAGVFICRAAFERVCFVEAIVAAAVTVSVDLYLFYHCFPHLHGRMAFFSTLSTIYSIAVGSRSSGAIAFISGIIVPFLMMAYFGSLQQISYKHVGAILLWVLLVGMVSCVLTLDHTRVACLLLLAPTIVFLRALSWRDGPDDRSFVVTFAIFCVMRTVIPHVDIQGPLLAQWTMFHLAWGWIWGIL